MRCQRAPGALPRAAGAHGATFQRAVVRRAEHSFEKRLAAKMSEMTRRIESRTWHWPQAATSAATWLCANVSGEPGRLVVQSALHPNYPLYRYAFAVEAQDALPS
jgi:hypothetical protein